MRKLLDDCFLHDKDRLKHAEALDILKRQVKRIAEPETVTLEACAGRILAETITSPRNVPLTDNSAVDGYAFAHEDYISTEGQLPVSRRIAAGDLDGSPLAPGTAARIFTGAVMPEGADTVAMQEDCTDDGDMVSVPQGLKNGANRRKAGEDLQEGDTLLSPGDRLRPQDVAALASVGRHQVSAYRKLRIAILSTGDELVLPGKPIQPGQVYDANRYLLNSLAATLPVEITDYGILPDQAPVISSTLEKAASNHDIILTSGGASRGEEDHIIDTMDRLGKRYLWQLAIKPGRPMSFGEIGDCAMIGLPGNPVAAMICFLLYARPAILALAGATWRDVPAFPVPAAFSIGKKKPDRTEFLRGILAIDETGKLVARKYQRDGSGLISSLREADGLIMIPEHVTALADGEPVAFLPFSELGVLR
ncbi:molybdopterin molybdotransferase MoeA [Coralliovum pocilloporae]|uniref:molybdopterin molybdotransferase MoeA n=1 Tax=Coralliovum pocilloporae TaxID=3066369 RepID=UPI003307911F